MHVLSGACISAPGAIRATAAKVRETRWPVRPKYCGRDNRRSDNRGPFRGEQREFKGKFCAAPRRVRDRDVAAERPHDAPHNRQAEACPLLAALAPPKSLEDLFPQVLRNARS